MSSSLKPRGDQIQDEDVGQIDTPFLQVALEDQARLPKPGTRADPDHDRAACAGHLPKAADGTDSRGRAVVRPDSPAIGPGAARGRRSAAGAARRDAHPAGADHGRCRARRKAPAVDGARLRFGRQDSLERSVAARPASRGRARRLRHRADSRASDRARAATAGAGHGVDFEKDRAHPASADRAAFVRQHGCECAACFQQARRAFVGPAGSARPARAGASRGSRSAARQSRPDRRSALGLPDSQRAVARRAAARSGTRIRACRAAVGAAARAATRGNRPDSRGRAAACAHHHCPGPDYCPRRRAAAGHLGRADRHARADLARRAQPPFGAHADSDAGPGGPAPAPAQAERILGRTRGGRQARRRFHHADSSQPRGDSPRAACHRARRGHDAGRRFRARHAAVLAGRAATRAGARQHSARPIPGGAAG